MNDLRFEFVSTSTHEHLVVEVLSKELRLVQINKESGIDRMEIQFLTDYRILDRGDPVSFPLADFEAILREAMTALRER
jgi:hypothetical protein